MDSEPRSMLAGVGSCLWDMIVGLWEIARFFVELQSDIDLAADGRDDLFFPPTDIGETWIHLDALVEGQRALDDFASPAQRDALQRIYAKIAVLRQELEALRDLSVGFVAAYDIHIHDTPRRRDLPRIVRSVLGLLAEGMSALYSPDEWDRLASESEQFVREFVDAVRQQWDREPWYVAGWALCFIATSVVPVSRFLSLINRVRPIFRAIDAAAPGGIQEVLRRRGLDLPASMRAWPNNHDREHSIDPDRDHEPPDSNDDADGPPDPDGEPDVQIEDDANPQRPVNPQDEETGAPDPDGETTSLRGRTSRTIGERAEAAARAQLEADGFETFELRNGSEHGPDIIAVHPDTGAIRVIEVKANSSRLNPLQQQGGRAYLENVFGRLDDRRQTTWNRREFDAFLERMELDRDELLEADFEVWRYRGVSPDEGTPVGAPQTTPWSAGRTGTEFRLDADGNIQYTNDRPELGDRRVWTDYVEPDEYDD